MEILVILFTCISVVLHTGWNLIAKNNSPSLSFFSFAIGSSAILFSPILVLDPLILYLPLIFWELLILTGLCQAIYMTSLAWAYSSGEISVIYPTARALPVIFVPIVSVFVFNSQVIDIFDWGAFILIVLGALMLPLDTILKIKFKQYFNPALGYALLAAVSTTSYSIIDGIALNMMEEQGYTQLRAGLSYMVLQASATIIWAIPIVCLSSFERQAIRKVISSQKTKFLYTGLIITTTYGLILIAISYAQDVSYVVAIRQLSIPLSIFLGIKIFKERLSKLKILGAACILIGLLSVSLIN